MKHISNHQIQMLSLVYSTVGDKTVRRKLKNSKIHTDPASE